MKNIWVLGAVVCLVSGCNVFAQETNAGDYTVSLYQLAHKPEKDARRLFVKAAKQLQKDEYGPGLHVLQKAILIDPDYWEVQNDIGYAYLQLGRIHDAQDAFQRAIDIDPENPVAYLNMGISAFVLRQYKMAEQSATRALRCQPTMVQAKVLLAFVKVEQGHWTPETRALEPPPRTLSCLLPRLDIKLQCRNRIELALPRWGSIYKLEPSFHNEENELIELSKLKSHFPSPLSVPALSHSHSTTYLVLPVELSVH